MTSFSKPISIILTSLLLSLPAASLQASVKSVTGQLSLMATLDGKPAFKPVVWQLKKTSPTASNVQVLKRHAATLDLEPGNYRVSVSMGAKTRTRQVTIQERKSHSVVISLD